MSGENTPRRASFVTLDQLNEENDDMTTTGAASRLPASRMDLDSDRSLVDLTPSGEVQMRVTYTDSQSMTTSDSYLPQNTNHLEIEKLRRELIEHREAERKITTFLDSHKANRRATTEDSCGGGDYSLGEPKNTSRCVGLRGQDDQCYNNGPGTNTPWKAPSSMRLDTHDEEGSHSCLSRQQPNPNRRKTFNTGNEFNMIDNSRSMTMNHENTSRPRMTGSVFQNKHKLAPTFDGSGSWQDFLVQFEMVSMMNNWDNLTKAYELATSLRGVAQGVVTEIEPARRFDFDNLVSALTSRFEPVNQENMYKVQINAFYRKQNQALPEMAQEIRRITRLAYPTAPVDIRSQLAKDCFLRALNDSKIQLSIFQREPKTIDDCVRYGVEYEAFTLDQRRIQQTKQGVRMITGFDDSDDEVMTRLAKISDKLDSIDNMGYQNTRKPFKCFYCGRIGHMKKECRKLDWDKQNNCVKPDQIPRNTYQSTQSTTKSQQNTHNGNRLNFALQKNM